MKLFELNKNENQQNVKESLELLGVYDLKPSEQMIVLNEISKYVFNINERHQTKEKTFDLNLDYKYYFVDFLRLGINLNEDEISWWEFDAILESLFLNEKSNLSTMLSYRLYEKPPKSIKAQEEKEHKFRMEMKRKYALPNPQKIENGFDKMWNYVEKKAGENKE